MTISAPVTHETPQAVAPPVVRTAGLTKRHGNQTVVDNLSLYVPRGGVYGFLGPNGAGKSSTMKMILGLSRPSSGSVEVFGQELRSNRASILPRIGSLIEGPAYYPHLSGGENLRLVADYLGRSKEDVGNALATVGLSEAAGKKAKHYSLGMKQRLGIAMALVSSPELLMLDEPTNGLDPSGVAEIRQLIKWLAHERGLTVMVSSHLLSEIEQMADVVGIIQGGQMRYQGPLAGLQDQGQLVLRATPADIAADHLGALGIRSQVDGDELILPHLPDDRVAHAVATLVSAGIQVIRVEIRRKTLEQAFLEMTETPVHPAPGGQFPGRAAA